MRDLRILFMGTPEFAVHSLKKIIEAGFNVVGVVTAPDKPAGRGRKLQESAVKHFAQSQDLKILQPENLKSEDFQKELQALNPNVQVVVAFRMLPEKVWQFPQFGTFNLHASLLPQYRGAAPINWAIINGEKETGVSTFFIDEKIDTGKVIFRSKTPIHPLENVGELHDRLMEEGGKLVVQTLEAIRKNEIKPVPQQETPELKEAPKLTKENTKIIWNKDINDIFNLIRGLDPYPAAWTEMLNGNDNYKVKIYKMRRTFSDHNLEPGKIISTKSELKVAVPGGYIFVEELQLPGKKKMPVKDLLNGFNFFPNAKFL